MCLAIPGKVLEIYEENGLKMGRIDYSGTVNTACLEYVPEIKPGQYTIVHAGFAISIVDEEEAQKTYAVWQELVEAAAEEGTDIFGIPWMKEANTKVTGIRDKEIRNFFATPLYPLYLIPNPDKPEPNRFYDSK